MTTQAALPQPMHLNGLFANTLDGMSAEKSPSKWLPVSSWIVTMYAIDGMMPDDFRQLLPAKREFYLEQGSTPRAGQGHSAQFQFTLVLRTPVEP